jgi:enoyl-CoA hydratase/carnithine racemase
MEFQNVILDKEAGIATITLNRPEKLNAISAFMRQKLIMAIEEVRKDDTIKVLIITGAGRGFCAGGDVTAMGKSESSERKEPSFRDIFQTMKERSLGLWSLDKPVIAAINGVAAGGGVELALTCDLRIASNSARFTVTNIKRGMTPDGGATWLLPRIVGMSRALNLMFTGDIIDANEAERIGLVDKVVPAEALIKEVRRLAARIAKGPSVALGLLKQAVHNGVCNDFEAQLEFEAFAQTVCRRTEDHQEGVRAFLEKREPVFKGK